ncbi:hypothetical protein VTK73DRAFT_6032 [Phialemonium thermophilum]|uniref:Putative phospholipase n=1 Tax=Phialemonium thermophilum TaxID=223376 RepID=A0ABR3XXF3_9PEZI
MVSSLSRLSPVPAFPAYTGPYKVGSVDVEIPVSELDSPSQAPEAADGISTVQFRVFYPATPDSNGPPVTWLPAPQRLHISAYTQFIGINSMLASVLSFLPWHLHYTSIPVHKNAKLATPRNSGGRWPTAVFSHGLGGSRNAYSQIAGSLASHGVVVVCPEHRDGSAAISIIREPGAQDRPISRNPRRLVPYIRLPHEQKPEIWRARDTQIQIRLWELGLIMEAMFGLDSGVDAIAIKNMNQSTSKSALQQFAGRLDVQEPGRIIFAGHSFGAATVTLFLKSTYYADRPEVANIGGQVFAPRTGSNTRRLITEKNPTILLDMWCFPLLSSTFAPLLRLPFPTYADVSGAPGGTALLAIESEAFYKWNEHLHCKARILSPDPTARVVTSTVFKRRRSSQEGAESPNNVELARPNFFYVHQSAHLSQSDFGILFPWLSRKLFGVDEPERALRLNMRAMLQHLRANGIPVARTWHGDLVDGPMGTEGKADSEGFVVAKGTISTTGDRGFDDGVNDDAAILDKSSEGAGVKGWSYIDIVGLGDKAGRTEDELLSRETEHGVSADLSEGEDTERQMEGEMEPGVSPVEKGAPVGSLQRATEGAAKGATTVS